MEYAIKNKNAPVNRAFCFCNYVLIMMVGNDFAVSDYK